MSKFKVGDRVKLNPEVTAFRHGRGEVNYDEVGGITKIDGRRLTIDFPRCSWWNGYEEEVVLAEPTTKIVVHKTGIYKEEKEMELLKIYEERKFAEIKKENDKKEEEIVKADEIYTKVKDLEKELNEKYDVFESMTLTVGRHTTETENKLKEAREEKEKAFAELDKKIREIKAQLDLCETYEQRIDILVSYGVIDKKTKALTV